MVMRGSLVAHTPVPLPRPEVRAQIWPGFSMVYTIYTLSMGTYWVHHQIDNLRRSS